jgi:hypothetical protein
MLYILAAYIVLERGIPNVGVESDRKSNLNLNLNYLNTWQIIWGVSCKLLGIGNEWTAVSYDIGLGLTEYRRS